MNWLERSRHLKAESRCLLSQHDPRLAVPAFARRASGLWAPTDIAPVYRGHLGRTGLAYPVQRFSSADRFALYPRAAADLDLQRVDSNGLVRMAQQLPLEPCLWLLCFVQAVLRNADTRTRGDLHLGLVRKMTDDPELIARLERWVREGDAHLIFTEQSAFALQRMLILHSPSQPEPTSPTGFTDALLRALLAVPEAIILPSEEPEATAQPIPMLLRNGGFNDWEDLAPLLARYHRIWGVHLDEALSSGGGLARPLAEGWYERFWGRTIREERAAAIAVYELANGFLDNSEEAWLSREEAPPAEALLISETAFSNCRLSADGAALLDAMSASSEEYAGRFNDLGHAAHDLAWNVLPFAERPLWRTGHGTFCPVSARLLVDWGTSGVFHRLGVAGEGLEGQNGARLVRSLFGWLVERYVRSVLAEGLAAGASGRERVVPPQAYGGGSETTDAIVPWGEDVVLFEVVSGGLTQAVLTQADADAADRRLRNLVVQKVGQVARVVMDLHSGRAKVGPLVGVRARRAFPVVVLVDGITQAEPVRAWLEDELANTSGASALEPFMLLDLGELEELAALLDGGQDLVSILERAGAPAWRPHGFSTWLERSPDVRRAGNLAVKRWLQPAMLEIAVTLFGEGAAERAASAMDLGGD